MLAAASGDKEAADRLLPLIYEQLRRSAQRSMASEAAGHTLSATALVHEAYLKLVGPREVAWASRGHFYTAAAEAMRIVEFASFSRDGTRVVTTSEDWDQTARTWDAQSGKELAKLEGHTSGVTSACFSPDGARIVTASRDNTVRLWDSVSRHLRYQERQALLAAQPAGERALDAALAGGNDFAAAGAKLRQDVKLDPFVKRAALNALLIRAQSERDRAEAAGSHPSDGK